ncbi:MAG: FlgD immunoglobulin-like domain containing protein [Armatimonadota bacterium]|nr:right-handed parallel beta-helix repeat-containing protein [Armatimonadota bacterium]MDW8143643.1 FlgD immunoglobulin-like domain containing protein [Armatimonadota bacterium]
MGRTRRIFIVALLIAVLSAASGKEFYVAPNGSPQGDGSFNNPWDLQTALNHPPQVQPGDIIWLRGGIYTGHFTSKLSGTEEKPIIVRSYPGEWAIIQIERKDPLGSGPAVLTIRGSNTWYWGFEVRAILNTRYVSETGSNHGNSGIDLLGGPNNRLINLVIHDVPGNGIGAWTPSQTTEVYGNIVFNNGWIAPDRGHGHGIYTQNNSGTKFYVDNVVFHHFGYGMHAYTEGGYLRNFYLEGNVFFNDEFLIGGLRPVENVKAFRNYLYTQSIRFGYRHTRDSKDLWLEENYFVGTLNIIRWQNITILRNKIYSGNGRAISMSLVPGFSHQLCNIDENQYITSNQYPFNVNTFNENNTAIPLPNFSSTSFLWEYKEGSSYPTWKPSNAPAGSLGYDPNGRLSSSKPTGVEIFIRPNKYELGRAHIIVFNWDKIPTVSVDLSSILPIGTPFEIRNVQDYFNAPVASGVYNGSPVILPMSDLSAAKPIGWNEILGSPTWPEFNVFVVIPKYPSIPQILLLRDNGKISQTPAFRIKAYNEFPIKFIIELAKDGQVRTYTTDYTTSGTELTFTLPEPLTPGKYTVRVKAQDRYNRESPYSEPFTIVVKLPPSPPTLIGPVNNSVVTPTPTFKFKASDSEGKRIKFIIEVKRNDELRVFETDWVNSEEEANFSIPPEQALAEGNYSWRVKARDEEGYESDWSESWNFLVNNPPSAPALIYPEEKAVVPSTPTFKVRADVPAGRRVRIRIDVLDEDGKILHQLTTPEVNSGQEVSVSLPPDQALLPGTYYWRAVASDQWMEGQFSETRSFRVFALSHSLPKGLLLISVPIVTEQTWAELLGLPEDQLRVVTWEPLNNRYVYASASTAPAGSAVGEIAARPHLGRGYWVKLGVNKEVYLVGRKVDNQEVAIDLQPGWNVIGCPFTKPIIWNPDSIKVRRLGEVKSLRDARASGWLEDYLWGWKQNLRNPDTGGYFLVYSENIIPESVSLMEPFNAYWIRAYVPCQLILEPPGESGVAKQNRQKIAVGNGFGICISAELNGLESKVFVGVKNGVGLKAAEPPTPPTKRMLQITLFNGEQELAVDIRDKAVQRMMWELEVRWVPMRGRQNEISLFFDGMASVPKGYSVFLVDKTTGKRTYLRTTPVYRFTPQELETSRRFVLLLEKNEGEILRVFNLKAQPMRGQGVAVKFGLTKPAQTTVEILTLTGRRVAIVEAGQARSAGEQNLFWRGTDTQGQPVGLGVYLLRVHAIDEEGRQIQAITTLRFR